MTRTLKTRAGLLNCLLVALLLISPALAQNFRLLPPPKLQFFDVNGKPLAGGHVYTYIAGTTTPFPTFTDSTGLIQNTNPTVLDSGGYASIWLGLGSYKIEVTDAGDVPQYTVDNVSLASISQSPFVSDSVDVATAGILRLGSADTICWRNNASNADVCLSKDTTDKIHFPTGLLVDAGGLTITAGKLTVNSGVSNNGTGFQHKRVTSCTTASGSAWQFCNKVVTWNTPFPDTNYTATCTLQGPGAAINMITHYAVKATTAITVEITNGTSTNAASGTIECIAVHD